jgi:N-carbamoyl-L-amino-acid hydrolase
MITLDQLNRASTADAATLLQGTYEHSPWIVERAAARRPFASLAQLKLALVDVVRDSGPEAQLGLIRAHPELAGKAMTARTLTAESTHEQGRAGLTDCTPEELAKIRQLNADYHARFGFPFVLAVRGPRGTGLDKAEIIATFERRLGHPPDYERAEALRNIHRIAELRLDDAFGHVPELGNQVWDWAERLAIHSDPGYAERGELTVTYLTDAHRACAQRLAHWMREDCGFDEVSIDAVGNVVGIYHGTDRGARRLLTGSHYDTVRNGGKYDGRLGILAPMACVRELSGKGRRLPFGLEVVGFAEEEGQRFKAVFLGSGALTGHFDETWLEQKDADGLSMREAMTHAGLCIADIPKLTRDASKYLGFVEVHIEQGPVLNEMDLPLGIVTSINGSVRYLGEIVGMASHAGTTPMDRRRDAGHRRRRAGAVPREARRAGAAPRGHDGHAGGAERLDQRRARALPLQPGHPRHDQRGARRVCRGRAVRAGAHLRAARPAPHARGDRARGRRAERTGLAAALGACRRCVGRAGPPHAERRRPRRDEAARGDAPGHAVRARPQCRHQPQPAGRHHQRRRRAERACLPEPAGPTRHGNVMTTRHHEALDAWIDAHFDEEVRFLQALVRVPTDTPPGNNAPHADAPPSCCRLRHRAEKHAVPARGAGLRAAVDHQPDRAPALRRRADGSR